ncbi:MAG: short-chain dehydrogenase [Hyphomicrobiales bacterium]|nr:short-chain dehydrogenase [Hyphomicrobiales bacterium]
MIIDLSGTVALVTGARHGIGAAAALALAQSGTTVFACGRREGDCAEIVAQIAAAGGKAFDMDLDVADLGSIRSRVEAVATRSGRLDIVVNNAAIIEPMARIADLDAEAFDLAMRTNVSGPAALVAAAWPHFAGGGRIINLLSGAALRPLTGWAAYCSSKAALLMLTRAADLEGAEHGIRSFGLAPGLVDTPMQASIRAVHVNEISDIPQSKLSAPQDAGRAIAWLASGRGDDYAGGMIDLRDAAFRARMDVA